MKPKKFDPIGLLLVAAGAWLLLGGGLPNLGPWNPLAPSAPFQTDKPAVLVIEESLDHRNYTSDQLDVIQSTRAGSVKDVVQKKGGHFQVIDDDAPTNQAPPWVQEAFKVPRQSLPWVVGADSRTGFSVPLTTEADILKRVEGFR